MSDRQVETNVETASAPAQLADLQTQLERLEHSSAQFPVALQITAPDLDPWQWLASNEALVRVAWSERNESTVTAGVGVAASIELNANGDISQCIAHSRRVLGSNTQLRFFGGFSFDGSHGWDGFGAGKFVIPRLTLADGLLTLAVMDADDVAQARLDLQQIRFEGDRVELRLPAPTNQSYLPSFDGWQSRVDEALSLIRSEVLEKIVLSRKANLSFAEAVCPVALSERLSATTHDCFVFCFNFGEDSSFIGATPERLFLRRGDLLRSEVVAGTRMRGATPAADEKLAIELLTSDKDQREHDIVRKSIRQKLHKFVEHLDVDTQASILRLARKQHLKSDVQGTLKAGVDDGMLLKRLHPTPAVGGYPTENALPEIARIEPFDRGWYAAPIGWIGAETSQFVVGIRSGLIQGTTLSLFSGAGIVRGSDPNEEWQEVDSKIQDFLSVLG